MALKPQILVVEDDKYWIEHHKVALKNVNVDVHEAQTVRQAINILGRQTFAGLAVDLEIPGIKDSALGGFEVLEAAKKLNSYTELFVITGHTEHQILDRVSRMNINFITKPVDHRELAISVLAVVNAWERRFYLIKDVLESFLDCHAILADRSHNRPSFNLINEYDVQDLLICIMKAYFPDVIAEEYTLKRAGKTKRLDLVIKGLETVIETKMLRNKDHGNKIADELDIDIRGYVAHPYCKRLFCYVYDPKHYIKDARTVERDLSGEASQNGKTIDVIVMIRPL
jgi:CheY-like chemotaxis protein